MRLNRLLLTSFLTLVLSTGILAHGTQVRWNIVPSTGAIRVWIEHWHGNAAGSGNYTSFPLNVSYTINGVTTYQTYYGSGAVDDTSWWLLPDGGNSSAKLSACPYDENRYNDWVYWDFNPPACNTPVSLTIIDGPSYHTAEACSNLYPVTINSNFNDNVGPAITANDITVPPSLANCGAVVANYGVTAVDACGGNVTTTYSIPEGSTFPQGTTPVNVTSTDQFGNVSTSTFNVIVADNQAPTVLTQNANVTLVNGVASITAADIDAGSYDNACGGIASMSVSPSTFDCSNIGANNVWLTVTDIYGNSATKSAMVYVSDPVAPTITGPGNITVTAQTGRCNAEVSYSVIASLYSCAIQQDLSSTPTGGIASGGSFPLGTTTNTFSVTDAQGRIANYSFDVTVVQPNPVGVNAGADQDICIGSSTQLNATLFNLPSSSSGANSNGSDVVCIYDAYSSYSANNCNFSNSLCDDGYTWESGTRSASYQASGQLTDINLALYYTTCGGTQTFDILINGQVEMTVSAPNSCSCSPGYVGTYPQNLTLTAADLGSNWNNSGVNTIAVRVNGGSYVSGYRAVVNYATSNFAWISGPNIADPSDPNTSVSPTATADYVAQYTTAEGCFATDTVRVNVNPLPSVSLASFAPISYYAAPITLSGGAPAGGTYSGTGVSNGTFDPGATSIGLQTIYYTYTDANGCTNTASATIDVIPCNIELSATSANATCPGGSDGSIDLTTANTNNGETFAWTGPNGFTASTEDLGGLSAGVYSVLVTDGNGCTKTLDVTVSDDPDDTAPTVLTQSVAVVLDANGNASISTADVDAGSNDHCGIASMSLDRYNFGCADVGTQTVTLSVMDVNGNVGSATASVSVSDNTAPVVMTQSATVSLDASGNGSISVGDIENGSSDACGIASSSLDITSFDCSNLGANTVTLSVTDVNGNTGTAAAQVMVVDQIDPAISGMPADITVVPSPNDCTPSVSWAAPGASDNCSVSLSSSHNPGDNFAVGTTTVTYTATDGSGNSVSASFTVTVSPTPVSLTISSPTFIGGDNISCNGATDGSIDLGVSGGCEPYSYAWSNGESMEDVSGLGAGTYSVTVTDANGQTATTSISLTEPAALTASASSSGYLSGNGVTGTTLYLGYGPQSINLASMAQGGHAPYTYSWNSGSNASSETVSPTATTTYTVTITDVNGCMTTADVTVSVIDARCSPGKSPSSKGRGNNGNGNGRTMNKVNVCHHGKTICIDSSAVASHLANHNHGNKSCTLGPCGSSAKNGLDLHNHFSVDLYPNPTDGVFHVQLSSEHAQDIQFVITDLQGRVIATRRDFAVDGITEATFDLSPYANGVYLLKVIGEGEESIKRIVKQ